MQRRKYLAVLASVAGMGLAGCSEDEGEFEGGSDGDSGGDGDSDGSSNDVELVEHEMVREDGGTEYETVAVEGIAENVSGGELDYAEVEVKFYAGDTLQESFLDNINGWSAGEQWSFSVQFPSLGEDAAEITDYEVRAGTSL